MQTQERARKLRERYGSAISDDEAQFLEDVKGLIDYATRNGISFAFVLGTLAHDVNGILQQGFSLSDAKKAGLLPKVTGYRELNAEEVGDPAELEEPE